MIDRRQLDRRGVPRIPDAEGLARLRWVILHGDTRTFEWGLGTFALIRGLYVFVHPIGSFPPHVEQALLTVMPLQCWGLTGIVPGAMQIVALMFRRVRYRRWAVYSNVGVLWMIAVLWALIIPGQLGAVAYATLGSLQLYLAFRLAAEAETLR